MSNTANPSSNISSDNKSFASTKLSKALVDNLNSLGYQQMTDIQAQSLPAIIHGQDVIAQGKTGSGKTAAFGLGLLNKLQVKKFRIQSLVLCPTRELADQVSQELRKLARSIHNIKILTLCGGMPFGPQVGSLEHGAHIIVGTPGRIEDHLSRGTLSLNHVDTFILDEADRMLEMGFQSAIDAIVETIPSERQTLLFSATFPDKIKQISARLMQDPHMVKVTSTHDDSSITQLFYAIDHGDDARFDATRLLLAQHQPNSAVIFCNTKKEVQQVADKLCNYGNSAVALHGDLEQRDRDQTLVKFANKSARILVATDVAARGLDVDNLDLVINYHVAHDTEVHVHRIGRTGRAGSKGLACTLYSDKETYKVGLIEDYLDSTIEPTALPSEADLSATAKSPEMVTLQIDGGKKQKVRPGDILGALTGKNGIEGKSVGKIQVFDQWAFVAVEAKCFKAAMKKLADGKMKGRTFRVRKI